jgi:ATP-dependent DNA helicase PIF1
MNIDETSTCNVKPNTDYGNKIKDVQLLIWDEISMAKKHAVESVEKCLTDLADSNEIFGGKVVVFSGDFRQTLPIVRFGNRVKIIENCVKNSKIWHNFECMSLNQNKRISEHDNEFKNWLLNVGNGNFQTKVERDNEIIRIPENLVSKGNLIEEIFGNELNIGNKNLFESVILTPTNADAIDINDEILNRMPGVYKEYVSIDTAEDDNNEDLGNIIPIEFLNSLTPNGLPPHKLKLKHGSIVMLLRNVNLNNGLCNGTRLIIEDMREFTIFAKIITGNQNGTHVIIPRINLSPSIEEIPFHMTRRQFPIRLAHAMTINKSQGQSFKSVGVYLPTPVFSHGQLYVALSRVINKNNLKIHIPLKPDKNIKKSDENTVIYTKNIVYTEIL